MASHASITRRTAIKGGLILAATSHTAVAVAPYVIDPLVAAINALREGEKDFLAISEDDWPKHGGDDAVVEATYGPPLKALDTWDRPAETKDGAIAALRFALEEAGQYSASASIGTMITAALAYLETAA